MGNIYLVGMMGAGKTATGKELARLARMDFVDLDELIQNETHLGINEIFQKKGEAFFRAEEKRLLAQAAEETHSVVATGGGIVLNPENVEKMKQSGRVIYLAASFETLWARVKDKKDRPLLAVPDPKATFFRLFQERWPLYEASSEGAVPTDRLSPEAVAKKIAEIYLK